MSTLNPHELGQLTAIETALRASDPALDAAMRNFRLRRRDWLRMAARRAVTMLIVGAFWIHSMPVSRYGFFGVAPWIRRP